MGKVSAGVNLEFIRHADKPLQWGLEKAAELGFEYVEPWVHLGRELMSEAGYYATISMYEDPIRIRKMAEKAGVKLSGFSCHTALCKPDVSGNYLKQAIRFAAEAGAPVVCTDEGPKPKWTTEEEDFILMKYTLTEAAAFAENRGVFIGLECHQQYSKTPAGLDRMYKLVKSKSIGINFDTGNAYLAGEDPLKWLESIKDRLVHMHAKDISIQHSKAERGKVTGTPAGCACGDGVIDWKKVIEICKSVKRDIVLSVECGTVEQAERSIKHLKNLLK